MPIASHRFSIKDLENKIARANFYKDIRNDDLGGKSIISSIGDYIKPGLGSGYNKKCTIDTLLTNPDAINSETIMQCLLSNVNILNDLVNYLNISNLPQKDLIFNILVQIIKNDDELLSLVNSNPAVAAFLRSNSPSFSNINISEQNISNLFKSLFASYRNKNNTTNNSNTQTVNLNSSKQITLLKSLNSALLSDEEKADILLNTILTNSEVNNKTPTSSFYIKTMPKFDKTKSIDNMYNLKFTFEILYKYRLFMNYYNDTKTPIYTTSDLNLVTQEAINSPLYNIIDEYNSNSTLKLYKLYLSDLYKNNRTTIDRFLYKNLALYSQQNRGKTPNLPNSATITSKFEKYAKLSNQSVYYLCELYSSSDLRLIDNYNSNLTPIYNTINQFFSTASNLGIDFKKKTPSYYDFNSIVPSFTTSNFELVMGYSPSFNYNDF